jgi:hypothetical protein
MPRVRPGRALAITLLLAVAGTFAGTCASAHAQQATHPLLPLGRGEVIVTLGDPPQWLPVSGTATGLTVFSGRAAGGASRDTAFVAVQRASRSCAGTPAGGHAQFSIPDFYSADHLVSRGSLYAPDGGAAPGDYGVTLTGVVLHETSKVRICTWLAHKASDRGLVSDEEVPLLNGLFAAAVSAGPSAAAGAGDSYTLNAVDVGRTFTYSIATDQCGTDSTDSETVPDGELGTESIAYGAQSCATDGSTVTFTRVDGGSLGTIGYTVADALEAPPEVIGLGGCELDGLTVTSVTVASQYVSDVGCSVGRLLVSPYQSGIPRGAVIEAQVDGGVAEVAPKGTTVDLVLNGA